MAVLPSLVVFCFRQLYAALFSFRLFIFFYWFVFFRETTGDSDGYPVDFLLMVL